MPTHEHADMRGAQVGSCVWCIREPGDTRDEVFPKFLGGTKDLALPSCTPCQTAISKAERHVASHSDVGLIRARTPGARPRHPKRARSGQIETPVLVQVGQTPGLLELRHRVGDAQPSPVASIELNLPANKLHYRIREGYPSLRQAIHARAHDLTRLAVDIADAPELRTENHFPRVYLDGAGRLTLRARTKREARKAIVFLKRNIPLPLADAISWAEEAISGAQPGTAVIRYDARALKRVVTKIGFGVLATAAPEIARLPELSRARDFVLGIDTPGYDPVLLLVDFQLEGRADWPEDHIAVVQGIEGELVAGVLLYSAAYLVQLGQVQTNLTGIAVARCRYPRGPARMLMHEAEALSTVGEFYSAVERTAAAPDTPVA